MLIICTLPNRKPTPVDQNVELKSFKAAFRHMFSPFTASRGQRVKRLIFLAASALFLTLLARVGIEKVQNLYLMNLPFCFDAVTLGWLLFARDLAQHIFAILAAFLFLRCLPGIILAMIGNLSAIAGFLMYAFAENDGEVFSVPALGLGQQLTLTIIRGEVSRLLGPEHQGPLFASLALLESIALAVSSPMLLSIYRATLDLFTGFAFLIAALILFVSIVMMGVFHVIWTRHIRHIQYQTLEVQIQTASNEAIEQ